MVAKMEFRCRECGSISELTASRQRFLEEKGFMALPYYCDACFAARLKAIWQIPGEKRLAVCAGCGHETKLHFIPSQDRPVYCSSCHQKN